MPPIMTTPNKDAMFHGSNGNFLIFSWSDDIPVNPYQWRVKVGSRQYGFDYYLGWPVLGTQLNDPHVILPANRPISGQTCWTVVEWKSNPGSGWETGAPTKFTFVTP